MLKSRRNWLAGAIASLLLAQTAVAATPPGDLSAQSLEMLLKEQRLVVCGDELRCWKRKTLTLDEHAELSLIRIMFLENSLQLATAENLQWKTKSFEQAEALRALKPALVDPVQPSVASSPTLWFGLGATAMAIVCISIFAIVKRIEVPTPQNR